MIEKEARLKVINLSRLEEIKDLRTVWPHEALDFTPWLSQDDNISLLADAVSYKLKYLLIILFYLIGSSH